MFIFDRRIIFQYHTQFFFSRPKYLYVISDPVDMLQSMGDIYKKIDLDVMSVTKFIL